MSAADHLWIPVGFQVASTRAGIKPSGGLDLSVFVSDRPCAAAGTFTTNRVCAAPVKWDRDRVPTDRARALVVNAGNANAATGAQGDANVARTASHAAQQIGCRPDEVLIASTGVIGHQLPMEKLEAGLDVVLKGLSADESAFHEASRAIMTTDTRPKLFSRREDLGAGPVSVLGVAKGAAMIGPRMATMLGFLFTDAQVDPNDLRALLAEAVDRSFNCVSVEGHTSTNDTVLCLANGASGPLLKGSALHSFATILDEACMDLARKIPEDGEGATHLITIDVEGCRDRDEARALARAVADSALVKTAIHGADPNWGRIVSAAGYAGVAFDETEVSLWLNGTPLYRLGTPLDFDAAAVSARLKTERDVQIRLTFQRGDASIRFWTCDLTAEYIHLNADYTT